MTEIIVTTSDKLTADEVTQMAKIIIECFHEDDFKDMEHIFVPRYFVEQSITRHTLYTLYLGKVDDKIVNAVRLRNLLAN